MNGCSHHRTVRAILASGPRAVLALQAGVLVTPANAQYSSSPSYQWQDAAIKRAFRDVLRREPNSSEMRRYRGLMTDNHWSEDDVRDDLKSRSDYREYSSGSRDVNPDRVIRRASEDILHREPDQQGLRHYRTEMIDNGWTEQDVRQALRKSTEHDSVSQSRRTASSSAPTRTSWDATRTTTGWSSTGTRSPTTDGTSTTSARP